MKRKCTLFVSNNDAKHPISIYIDIENKNEIIAYFSQSKRHNKKMLHIVEIMLNNYKVPKLYDKEDINDECKDVRAMKFFKGQENDRLYCKEMKTKEGTIIVLSVLHLKKKSEKNSQREIASITKVAKYEYEIN